SAMYGVAWNLALVALVALFYSAFRAPGFFRVPFTAGTGAAAALELAIEVGAALLAVDPPQREPHGLAHLLPFLALAAAGIAYCLRPYELLRVMRAQQPAHSGALVRVIRCSARLVTCLRRPLDACAVRIEKNHVLRAERNRAGQQQLAAARIECQSWPDL